MQAVIIPPSLLRRGISSVIIRPKLACKKVGHITRDCDVAEWFCDILLCESAPRFLMESNSSLSLSTILRPPHLRPAFAQLRGHFAQGVVEALDERMSELRTLHKRKGQVSVECARGVAKQPHPDDLTFIPNSVASM